MVKKLTQKIVILVGPTASGKSDLALRLAKLAPTFAKASADRQGKPFKKLGINGAEIISADSRQVYRGMDIGTGKVKRDTTKAKSLVTKARGNSGLSPSALDLKQYYHSDRIRHHLIDVADPKKQFTASDFKRLGEKAITDIASRNKVPIIVGGTGFYVDVLLGRMVIAQVPPNPKLRKRFDRLSAEHLFKMLRKLDPVRAKNIDRHNKRRLIRALEISINSRDKNKKNSKSKITSYHDRINMLLNYFDILYIGVNPGKERLAKNIKNRLDKRLKDGMAKEVSRLHKESVSWKRLDDFGLEYRWISKYLVKNLKLKISAKGGSASGGKSFKNSEEYAYLLRDIIRYSKRQMTWFKRNDEIHWVKNTKTAEQLVRRFVS